MKKQMMLVLLCVICLCSCGSSSKGTTWQEQYDLGVRYLSEGNYEEAIIAFTAAIEIDPKREEAYISLANLYVLSGDYENAARTIALGQENCGELDEFQSILDELPSQNTRDEIDEPLSLDAMLQQSGAISYSDIPELFSAPYDQLDEYLPLTKFQEFHDLSDDFLPATFDGYERTGVRGGREYSLNLHDRSYGVIRENHYGGNGYSDCVTATAPIDSSSILFIWMNWMEETYPIGLRDISMGDKYSLVLEKMGLSPSFGESCKAFELHLYSEGKSTSATYEEYRMFANNAGVPTIKLFFYPTGSSSYEKEIELCFDENEELCNVRYYNSDMLENLIQQSFSMGDNA